MAITSEDIHNQSFSIDRKGYDVDEVDVFLEHVADEIGALNAQVESLKLQLEQAREDVAEPGLTQAVVPVGASVASDADTVVLQERIADLERKLAEKSANDTAISQALIVAQRSADDIVANARSQASTIVQDADAEAERIVSKAEAERQKVVESTRALENARENVRADYRNLLSDFIGDASRKLNEIDENAPRSASSFTSEVAPLITPSASEVAGQSAASPAATAAAASFAAGGTATAAGGSSSYFEKDLSGFGDADDDFDFDDPD